MTRLLICLSIHVGAYALFGGTMAKDDHALEVQHQLIPDADREALGTALLQASVQGHADLSRVLLTLMSMTASGKITHEQADALRAMSELLFTNICAQNIHAAQTGADGEAFNDPLVARLKQAQAGAKKIRPKMILDDGGAHEYGLEVLDKKGNAVPLVKDKK